MSCTRLKKADCVGECKWIVGKGCRKNEEAKIAKPLVCEPSDLKKYTSRNSPPYPAANCRGVELQGKDGMYVSKADKNGTYKWYKVRAKSPVKSPVKIDADFAKFVKLHSVPKQLHAGLLKRGLNFDYLFDADIGPYEWKRFHNETFYIPKYASFHQVDFTKKNTNKFRNTNDVSIFNKYKRKEWNRGDVLGASELLGSGNNGKAMWDGEKAIALDYDFDNYGAIPSEFKVGAEFPAYYSLPSQFCNT